MHGPRAAERHHGRGFGIAAALRHMHADGGGHGLVDHVVHRPGRLQGGAALRPADIAVEAGGGSRIVERHRAAGENTGFR